MSAPSKSRLRQVAETVAILMLAIAVCMLLLLCWAELWPWRAS